MPRLLLLSFFSVHVSLALFFCRRNAPISIVEYGFVDVMIEWQGRMLFNYRFASRVRMKEAIRPRRVTADLVSGYPNLQSRSRTNRTSSHSLRSHLFFFFLLLSLDFFITKGFLITLTPRDASVFCSYARKIKSSLIVPPFFTFSFFCSRFGRSFVVNYNIVQTKVRDARLLLKSRGQPRVTASRLANRLCTLIIIYVVIKIVIVTYTSR